MITGYTYRMIEGNVRVSCRAADISLSYTTTIQPEGSTKVHITRLDRTGANPTNMVSAILSCTRFENMYISIFDVAKGMF